MTVEERIDAGEQPAFADFPDSYVFQGHDSGDIFWIDWFVVPKSQRGKGRGRAFYQALEAWLGDAEPEAKPREIRLMAADSGDGPSDGFWEKMGFSYLHDNPSLPYEVRQIMTRTTKPTASGAVSQHFVPPTLKEKIKK